MRKDPGQSGSLQRSGGTLCRFPKALNRSGHALHLAAARCDSSVMRYHQHLCAACGNALFPITWLDAQGHDLAFGAGYTLSLERQITLATASPGIYPEGIALIRANAS